MGLLGMVALVLTIESALMARDLDFSTAVATNWEFEGARAARQARDSDILCFGDSMVKFGVQPRILGPSLGKKAYNMALYCGPSEASYFLLKRSLDAGAKPSAVVVDFQPEFLIADSIKILYRVFPELLTWREGIEMFVVAREWNRLGEFAVAKALPSARKRYEIRASVLAAIKGGSASIKPHLLTILRNWQVNRGAEVLPKHPEWDGVIPKNGQYDPLYIVPWQPRELNIVYLEKFLDLASSRKIPVFWLIQPNIPEIDARREKVGYNAEFTAYVKACQARYPNLVAIDGRKVGFPYDYFMDPVHLDRDGAASLSFGVAEVIRTQLAGKGPADRWYPLPDLRHRAREVTLEDGSQSEIALRAVESGGTIRR
jgi:hypothetical protein